MVNFAVDPVVTTFNPSPVTLDWDASVMRSIDCAPVTEVNQTSSRKNAVRNLRESQDESCACLEHTCTPCNA